MSEQQAAKQIRQQMQRARALQAEIDAAGLGPPDPCKDLRAAARAVIDHWGRDELRNRHVNALRAALAAAGTAEGVS